MKYGCDDITNDLARLSQYALERRAQGLAGIPAHPKTRAIAMGKIAAETGISIYRLSKPEVQDHLKKLVAVHGLENPAADRRREVCEKVREAYRDQPLPARGNGVHFEQIAHRVGCSMKLVLTRECRDVIEELRREKEPVRLPINRQQELRVFAEYGQKLISEGRKIPCNTGHGTADISRISRETGLPRGRFSYEPMKGSLKDLVARVGLEDVDTAADEVARVKEFVDRAIAEGRPVPMGTGPHAHSVALKKIAGESRCTVSRLSTMKSMSDEIDRWVAACGHGRPDVARRAAIVDTDPRAADEARRLTEYVENAMAAGRPVPAGTGRHEGKIAFTQIARETGISRSRLMKMQAMRSLLNRWETTCGVEAAGGAGLNQDFGNTASDRTSSAAHRDLGSF